MSLKKDYIHQLQRKIDEMNIALDADNLWQGRFFAFIYQSNIAIFDDGSGGILHAIIRFVDKKTFYYHDYHLEYAPFFPKADFELWEVCNNFIVNAVDVWHEVPAPGEEGFAHDYAKTKIPNELRFLGINCLVTYSLAKHAKEKGNSAWQFMR